MSKNFLSIGPKYIMFFFMMYSLVSFPQEIPYTKVFFENSKFEASFYESEANYSGNSWIENVRSKIPVSDKFSFTPKNSLKLSYVSSDDGNWSATIHFDKVRGMDFFKNADKLSFWLFVEDESAKEALPQMSIHSKDNKSSKSITIDSYVEIKTGNWQRVLIPLDSFSTEMEVQTINDIEFSQGNNSKDLVTIYIDQIELISDSTLKMNQTPILKNAQAYEKHIDISWEKITDSAVRYVQIYRATNDSKDFKLIDVQNVWISGYSDFVNESVGTEYTYKISFLDANYKSSGFSNTIKAKTKRLSNDELMNMVQLSNFRYYWEGCELNSGLALENIPGRTTMIATGASGFGMMAIIAGVHRGFITRKQAAERFLKITRYLKKADRFHGVYPHFLNGETGKVVPFFGNRDNGGDLVETSFLFQGLLTAREFFDADNNSEKEIRKTIGQLWKEVEWDWYRKEKNSDFLYWHWSPDQTWVINHKLIGWNETMITYFLAIASPSHSVPASMYYSGWASPSKEAQEYRSNWGKTTDGSMYTNGKTYCGIELPVGVSNGGPLFFVHYSFLGLDPHKLTDAYTNYFETNQKMANINLRYCIENPENHEGYGADFWGLTASDGPDRYSADEPNPENDKGKMTATGSLASFPYTSDASMQALKNFYYNHGSKLYGYYGFHDAISLDEQWISPIYMGLNQAPIVVMIENYRSGLLWNLFMKNKDIKNGLEKLNAETQKKRKIDK